jgi:antitoxin (DNA-binding transcriptional repressor) of toxin-antitoxin stability system
MIQATVSEMKNRLSYYLRLVRGGEQVEILDRTTPVARLVHVAAPSANEKSSSWIKEIEQQGVVSPPVETTYPREFLTMKSLPATKRRRRLGVLRALLEERESGR